MPVDINVKQPRSSIIPESDEVHRFAESEKCRNKIVPFLGMIALLKSNETKGEHLNNQIITELAESLDATNTVDIGEQSVINGEMHDLNGCSLSQSMYEWACQQQVIADKDPSKQWFADFTWAELHSHFDAVAFSQNAKIGDTKIEISAMPENAPTMQVLVEMGFRVDLQRSFARAYTKTANGVSIMTQSIDGASVELYNAVLKTDARTADALLMTSFVDESGQSAEATIASLASAVDTELNLRNDGVKYRYGQPAGGTIEANAFVLANQDIIAEATKQLQNIPLNMSEERANASISDIFYKAKALLAERYARSTGDEISWSSSTPDGGDIGGSMDVAGSAADDAGVSFGGCSGSNSLSSSSNSNSSNDSSARLGEAAKYVDKFNVRAYCRIPNCLKSSLNTNTKSKVGDCLICEGCNIIFNKYGDEYDVNGYLAVKNSQYLKAKQVQNNAVNEDGSLKQQSLTAEMQASYEIYKENLRARIHENTYIVWRLEPQLNTADTKEKADIQDEIVGAKQAVKQDIGELSTGIVEFQKNQDELTLAA